MKRAEVRVGTEAMLSLGGRRGAVRVRVEGWTRLVGSKRLYWTCVDSSGRSYEATARQLQRTPEAVTL